MTPIKPLGLFVKPTWVPTSAPVKKLSQSVTASPMTPPSARPPFIDSALVGFLLSGAGAVSTGILAYGASTVNKAAGLPGTNSWAFIFGIMSGLLSLKAVADLSEIRVR